VFNIVRDRLSSVSKKSFDDRAERCFVAALRGFGVAKVEANEGRHHARPRPERIGGETEEDLRTGGLLSNDAEDAVVLRRGAGDQALGHFLLEHQRERIEAGGIREESQQDGRRDRVGEIPVPADPFEVPILEQLVKVDFHGIGFDELESVARFVREPPRQPRIRLEREHTGSGIHHGKRELSLAGSDLEEGFARSRGQGFDDARDETRILEEALPHEARGAKGCDHGRSIARGRDVVALQS